VETITADNCNECVKNKELSAMLNIDFYFVHPYAFWECSTNENISGLIRQYFPKDRSLSAVTAEEECFMTDRLNSCPKKCLDFRTSYEAFFNIRLLHFNVESKYQKSLWYGKI
jgi:IS30 family transposase